MRKFYITHNPAELFMALVQLDCAVGGAWLTVLAPHPILKFILCQLSVLAAALCWMFLFTMSGSRKREEAARKTEVSHG